MYDKPSEPIRAIVVGTLVQLRTWLETVWQIEGIGRSFDIDDEHWDLKLEVQSPSPVQLVYDVWVHPDLAGHVFQLHDQNPDWTKDRAMAEIKEWLESERKTEAYIVLTEVGRGVEVEIAWESTRMERECHRLLDEIRRRWEVEIILSGAIDGRCTVQAVEDAEWRSASLNLQRNGNGSRRGTDQDGAGGKKLPRVPRGVRRAMWIATWRNIRTDVDRGIIDPRELLGKLAAKKETEHLGRQAEDTMRDIIAAGIAGLLDSR